MSLVALSLWFCSSSAHPLPTVWIPECFAAHSAIPSDYNPSGENKFLFSDHTGTLRFLCLLVQTLQFKSTCNRVAQNGGRGELLSPTSTSVVSQLGRSLVISVQTSTDPKKSGVIMTDACPALEPPTTATGSLNPIAAASSVVHLNGYLRSVAQACLMVFGAGQNSKQTTITKLTDGLVLKSETVFTMKTRNWRGKREVFTRNPIIKCGFTAPWPLSFSLDFLRTDAWMNHRFDNEQSKVFTIFSPLLFRTLRCGAPLYVMGVLSQNIGGMFKKH